MKEVYGYIRVSTVRQGVQGVSLQEQRSAIKEYARKHDLIIIQWFEERETAAKRGRPFFTQMLNNLKKGQVSGVVIHKIDRSARNLKDWAELGELLDRGIEVYFAHESLDLHARGGRLSADIQAVIAADYIRNLREETKKGLYGRLKQGIYPLPAPIGYLDKGAGKPKEPDPARAPLIKEAFKLYASGEYSLDTLVDELTTRGLRNRKGGEISRNGLAVLLRNPFYMGIIRIKRSGETFKGIHEPLISKYLFDTVQDILDGKTVKGKGKHSLIFRRLFTCPDCGYSLIGEKQKGFVYYRCHTKTCKANSVREEKIEEVIRSQLKPLQLCEYELAELNLMIDEFEGKDKQEKENSKKKLKFQYKNCEARLDRLTDAYIDRDIEKDSYLRRKESLLKELKEIEGKMACVKENKATKNHRVSEYLELIKSLHLSYFNGFDAQKRQILKTLTLNRQINRKNVVVELNSPFKELAEVRKNAYGAACRARTRSMGKLTGRQKKNEIRKSVRKIYEILCK